MTEADGEPAEESTHGTQPAIGRLTRHGRGVDSVFDLLGTQENDLTAAFGFGLSRSPELLRVVLARVMPGIASSGQATVSLEVRDVAGRTDLEIAHADGLIVVEAKKGWLLPTAAQLGRYAPRIIAHGGGVLVTLSEASSDLAAVTLPREVGGVPVLHVPWRQAIDDIRTAQGRARGRERLWLNELRTYLQGATSMLTVADSWVYCVVVNDSRPAGGGERTFKQFVTDDSTYFHPFGVSGWPENPPNFLAFRWGNSVQRIHRVVDADVIPRLVDRWPDIPATDDTVRPHAVYKLGPRIPPMTPIPSGTTYRAARLWVLLDQLQVQPTLKDAVASSKALRDRRR